jgi:XTP/dITP diphosphohydrolase
MAASAEIDIQPLRRLNAIPVCEETGATFDDNAVQKARHYSKYCSGYLFAEDSGLSVDSLAGAPGVYSARFAGPAATDDENNSLLLQRLDGVKHRAARYICVIALAHAGEVLQTFHGEVKGTVLEAPRGHGGFGYDPLFYYEPFGKTFAEVPQEQKQTVSHRGRALELMLAFASRLQMLPGEELR